MASKHRWTKRAAAFALVLVLSAGCQSPAPRQSAAPLSAPSEPATVLTAAQQADVKIALGRSLEKGGDLNRAITCYTEAAAKDPTRIDACLRLAVLHELQGRPADSQECYRKALAAQPNNPDIYCNLGYSYYLQADWVRAADYLRHAVQLKPDHVRAHNNLGLVLARQWQADEALAEFAKAGCSKADAHVNLAYCFMVDGNPAHARQHYEIALKLDPNSAAAKRALQDLNALAARPPHPAPGAITPVSASSAPSPSPDPAWRAPAQQSTIAGESP